MRVATRNRNGELIAAPSLTEIHASDVSGAGAMFGIEYEAISGSPAFPDPFGRDTDGSLDVALHASGSPVRGS